MTHEELYNLLRMQCIELSHTEQKSKSIIVGDIKYTLSYHVMFSLNLGLIKELVLEVIIPTGDDMVCWAGAYQSGYNSKVFDDELLTVFRLGI